MFAKIVKGITRWATSSRSASRPAPRPRPRAATPEAPTQPREVEPRTADRAPAADDSRREKDALREEAEGRLAQAAEKLERRFGRTSNSETALRLLRSVVKDGPGMIRQPPMAAQAVLAVTRRPGYSLPELTKLIEKDPALAQKLLKHANSAFYAVPGSEPIVAITAAVQRIGTNGVNSTVMSSIIGGELSRPGAEFNEPAGLVWTHMVRVAPLARRLARSFGIDAEAAFTLGLVHDVGKLVLFDRLGAMRREARKEIVLPGGFLSAALSSLHEDLGCIVALEWGMSPAFARAVGNHHRGRIPDGPDPASEVVFLAERSDLCDVRGAEMDLEAVWKEGALTGSPERATAVFEAIAAEREQAEENPYN